jgi:hypothetical protein
MRSSGRGKAIYHHGWRSAACQGSDGPMRDWMVPDMEKILAAKDGVSVSCLRAE